MPGTLFPVLPWDSPLSSAPLGISRHSSLNKSRRTLGPDVYSPLSMYLEKSHGGYSQNQLQVLLTSGPSPDPSSHYRIGQRVWLSTSGRVPQTVPSFHWSFSHLQSSTAVHLVLLRTLLIHPTFHESKIKPLSHCSLSSVPGPPRVIDGHPSYTVKRLLGVRPQGRGFQYMVTARRRVAGFPLETSWIQPSSMTSTTDTPVNQVCTQVGRQVASLEGEGYCHTLISYTCPR
jgi:hypothetical protein